MARTYDADGAKCPVCKVGGVVVEIDSVPTTSIENIPLGPSSRGYYRTQIISIHCSNFECQTKFNGIPGRRPLVVSRILEEVQAGKR